MRHILEIVRRRRTALLAAGVLGVLVLTAVLVPAWRTLDRFDAGGAAPPSRLYARPAVLRVGAPVDTEALVSELTSLGYFRTSVAGPPSEGRFATHGPMVEVFLRSRPTAGGATGPSRLAVDTRGGLVAALAVDGHRVDQAALEPPLLACFLGPERVERRWVALDELPDHVVRAVLAAEDDAFFSHPGISPTSILRAAWADLRGGGVYQGGSTLTQQLVKNVFLTPERTLTRKAKEAVLAVLLELRFSKRAILQAYLNDVYLGADDGVSLVGLGAAARAYFGRDAQALTLTEAATLAGLIASPARFSPLAHPERARLRRNAVLAHMHELGWIDDTAFAAATAAPVATAHVSPLSRLAPYFAELARREAVARFGVDPREQAGLSLLSTLSVADQTAAEDAVEAGLNEVEAAFERRHRGALQAALVSVDPADGSILAWVGGRDWGTSQFDRAADAHRQAGSAFKPVIYAAAFEQRLLQPASLIADEPLTVPLPAGDWSPRDDDGAFLGEIPVRDALEDSRNVPAVRAALDVGLPAVVSTARTLGVTSELEPIPSLALGAFPVTPLELTTVYATLASGGVRPPVHALDAVLDAAGQPVAGTALPAPERALPANVAYLLTSVLEGVVDRGTGAGVRRYGVRGAVAGKTGTSNERRDSWFAGYSSGRATTVWVGLDDNTPTRLSGARGAVPIWGRFVALQEPEGGYPPFPRPEGVVEAVIDPATGGLATVDCPTSRPEVFLAGAAPTELCPLHRGFLVAPSPQPEVKVKPPGRFRRFLMRLFGKKDG